MYKITNIKNKIKLYFILVYPFLRCSTKEIYSNIRNLNNFKIGDVDGVSFEIIAKNELGLIYNGFGIAGIKNKKFYSVYFIAPKINFYKEYEKEAKKIISSIKIL